MKNIQNTENKIFEAARIVFHQRGFNGARMQEIANEAGINKALLHYYFRNKEALFEKVLNESFSEIASRINEIFLSEMTLMSKIGIFVSFYIGFVSRNSFILHFINNSLYEKPERLREIAERNNISPGLLLDQLGRQVREELGVEYDPLQLFVNLFSLVVFPIVARPLLQSLFQVGDRKMEELFEERKKNIPTFIENALKGYEKHSHLNQKTQV